MNKFNDEFEELKNKNQEIKLDDDFKANLKIKLDEEISRHEEKLNRKPNINLLPRKLIPVTACLFVLLATCCTFADEIESLVKGVFSNIDTTVEEAIAKGNYQKIDMEYVDNYNKYAEKLISLSNGIITYDLIKAYETGQETNLEETEKVD